MGIWWGNLEPLVQLLMVFMVLDIATGLLRGYALRELSSDVSRRGVARKGIMLLLVAAAKAAESHVGGLPLAGAVAGFYLAHEGVSILENAAGAGLPVPQALREALVKLANSAERGKL